jgi:carboxymethylenebutenolidase
MIEEPQMTTESSWIEISTHDGQMGVHVTLPPVGTGPGIVLLQEIFGVNHHIRGVAQLYALAGYVVYAPDIFWRHQPRLDLSYSKTEYEEALSIWRDTDVDVVVEDVKATAKALRTAKELDGPLSAVGFCYGARLGYLASTSGCFDAIVAYYGGSIHERLDIADQIKGSLLFHYAEHDEQIPQSAVNDIAATFAARPATQLFVYPDTQHGFNCWGREMFNQAAAALALGRTLSFLSEARQG